MNDDYNSIITLYNNYYSLEDISEKVNKSRSVVYKIITKLIKENVLEKRVKSSNKIDHIILHNLDKSLGDISKLCNKSEESVKSRIYLLKRFNKIDKQYKVKLSNNILKSVSILDRSSIEWTEELTIRLKDLVSKHSLEKVSNILQIHPIDICEYLYTFSNISYYENSNSYIEWTKDKHDLLLEYYSELDISSLEKLLGFKWKKIFNRAKIFGLKRKFIYKTSRLESYFVDILNQLEIEFEAQVEIPFKTTKYYADFVCNSNIIFELQGDYWHGNPIKFPNPTDFQKTKIANDSLRKGNLESLGYKVIYIWEYDVKNNIELVISKIHDALLPV